MTKLTSPVRYCEFGRAQPLSCITPCVGKSTVKLAAQEYLGLRHQNDKSNCSPNRLYLISFQAEGIITPANKILMTSPKMKG
jgi:hypothetical protein